MRKSKRLLILVMCVSIIFSGCGAVVGGGMVAKALSWLTFWKKDDVSTSGMTETERMKSAFSEYTGIAKTAMTNAKNGLTPEEKADTEDVEYIVAVNDLTLEPYDFFAVWLENYQKNHPESDFSEIGNLVTVENLQTFFTDNYFEQKSKTDYISADGTTFANEEAALSAASLRAEKRTKRAEKQAELDKLPPEEYSVTYSENPEYAEAKSNYENFLSSYNSQQNHNAKSAMYGTLQAYYDTYMSTPQQLETINYTDNTKKIADLESEIALLDEEIEKSKIAIITTVEIKRKDTLISDLEINAENVEMMKQFLEEGLK